MQWADSCPVVVAFARWIANFDWQRTHTELPFPESEGILGVNEMDASETLWAFNALTDFYCCLVTAVTFRQYLLAKDNGVTVAREIFEQLISDTATPRINWGCFAIQQGESKGGLTSYLLVRADERCFKYVAPGPASSRTGNGTPRFRVSRVGRPDKFSDELKLKILRDATETSVSVAAKKYRVDLRTFTHWRKKRKDCLDGMVPP
jgi:hypothetical protein